MLRFFKAGLFGCESRLVGGLAGLSHALSGYSREDLGGGEISPGTNESLRYAALRLALRDPLMYKKGDAGAGDASLIISNMSLST